MEAITFFFKIRKYKFYSFYKMDSKLSISNFSRQIQPISTMKFLKKDVF